MIQTGDQAPDFTLQGVDPDGQERTYHLSELLQAGRTVILYFYPRDHTPGCTTEACDFRDRGPGVDPGVLILGVSADSLGSHRKFQTEHRLDFPLLSDPDHAVMVAYEAWGEKKNYGQVSMGVIRSTFVIGPEGLVRQAHHQVKATGHAARVLAGL